MKLVIGKPIFTRFKINKLYGYKDVEIRFNDSVLIIVAGNGSGKTTILNSLHAFLSGRFHRLKSLEFESIECDFSDGEMLILHKSSITEVDDEIQEKVQVLARDAELNENELIDFLTFDYKAAKKDRDTLRSNRFFKAIYMSTPLDFDEVISEFDDISNKFQPISDDANALIHCIKREVGDLEILYLPTYRRVENPLLSPRRGRKKTAHALALRRASGIMETFQHAQINYGLEDVEQRLAQLSEDVDRLSNIGYRKASANIIDDGLSEKINDQSGSERLPDIDALKRFLSRVAASGNSMYGQDYLHPEQNENRITDINKLYQSGEIKNPKYLFLRYFLINLGSVIEKTKVTESKLQIFVDACNAYFKDSSDEKSFRYDQDLMKVSVIDSWTQKEVLLSQLSSGEKQIVSILAKLHLDDKKKIVLVDEPELSLSLEWQRRFLPDMMKSNSVVQLLAITHSPFVFENELDPFAGTLCVSKRAIENVS